MGMLDRVSGLLVPEVTNLPVLVTKQVEQSFDVLQKSILAPTSRQPKSLIVDPFLYLEQFGYREKPSRITFDHMKQMVERNSVLAAIVQTRVNQVAAFAYPQVDEYSVGFRISLKDRRKTPDEDDKRIMGELEEFISSTGVTKGTRKDDFETFLRKITRDTLTYDAVSVETTLRRNGQVADFYAVDATTIRLAEYEYAEDELRDIQEGAKVAFVQVLGGAIDVEYTDQELCYWIRNPRTDLYANGYGLSELEMIVQAVTAHLWAEEYNRRYFSQGSAPKGILNIKGNIQPEQLEAFKRQWAAQIAGVSNAWKTPILNGEDEIQFIPFNQSSRDMEYGLWLEYLIKVCCAVYQVDPSEVNFDLKGGQASAPLFESSNEAKQKLSRDRGLKPLLKFMANNINRHVIDRIDDRFKLEFVGLDAKTPEETLDMDIKALQNFKTLNEVRRKNNLPPIDGDEGELILNPIFAQAKQQAAALAGAGPLPEEGPGGGEMPPEGGPPGPEAGGGPPPAETAGALAPAGEKSLRAPRNYITIDIGDLRK